jgi:catechol 2,3-dioxygenase-like lactoylglutathione lyase family enzyme
MHLSLQMRILVLAGAVAVTGLTRLLVWRMRPETAEKLVPWTSGLVWLFWIAWVALTFVVLGDRGPYLVGLGMMSYSTALLSRGWLRSRAEFEHLPLLGFRTSLLRIPSRTLIKVKDLGSTSSWYTEKLGLRRLRQQSGQGSLALKFSENDHQLILVTDETVVPFVAPHHAVLFTGSLAKAREALSLRGIKAGQIQVDLGGTHYFEFRDPEGNEIEVCASH